MKIYRIENSVEQNHYEGTKGEAHKWVKEEIPKHQWDDVRIVESEVATDKAGVIALMNNCPVFTDGQAWGVTKRGGLEDWK